MRLKSAVWVAAYIRRCHIEGAFAAVRRRGAEEAGAIFVKLNRLHAHAGGFGPGPQGVFAAARPADRGFSRCLGEQPAPEAKIEERLARELRFDPDAWILEVEDRAGRHFLDQIVPSATRACPRSHFSPMETRASWARSGRRDTSDKARRAFSAAASQVTGSWWIGS